MTDAAIAELSAQGVATTRACAAHPERFVRKTPQPPALPAAAWINKPDDTPDDPH